MSYQFTVTSSWWIAHNGTSEGAKAFSGEKCAREAAEAQFGAAGQIRHVIFGTDEERIFYADQSADKLEWQEFDYGWRRFSLSDPSCWTQIEVGMVMEVAHFHFKNDGSIDWIVLTPQIFNESQWYASHCGAEDSAAFFRSQEDAEADAKARFGEKGLVQGIRIGMVGEGTTQEMNEYHDPLPEALLFQLTAPGKETQYEVETNLGRWRFGAYPDEEEAESRYVNLALAGGLAAKYLRLEFDANGNACGVFINAERVANDMDNAAFKQAAEKGKEVVDVIDGEKQNAREDMFNSLIAKGMGR